MPNSLTKPLNGLTTLIFDIETNGLLQSATRLHCVAVHFSDTDAVQTFNDEPYGKDEPFDIKEDAPMASNYSITTALGYIECADVIIGHNIINYDIPVIKRIYNWFNPTGIIVDTLLLSRLYHPNLYDIDKNTGKIPTKLYGSHSLEAYGYRLGEYKGNFGKETDWKKWSQEMQDYCKQDVVVTKKLCDHFLPYLTGSN